MLDYETVEENTVNGSANYRQESPYLEMPQQPQRKRKYTKRASSQQSQTSQNTSSQDQTSDRHEPHTGSGENLGTNGFSAKEKKRLLGLSDLCSSFVVGMGLFASAVNNETLLNDARIVGSRAESLSEKWVLLCRQYPELGKATDRVLKATPIGALLSEFVGIGLLIAANHGMSIPGVGVAQAA